MKTLESLKSNCQSFLDNTNPSAEDFRNLIVEAIPLDLIDCESLEVHKSTTLRWASGIAQPLPRFKKVIIREIVAAIDKRLTS